MYEKKCRAPRRSNYFGEMMRKKRNALGMTIYALAREMPYHFTYISKIERGDGDMRGGPGPGIIDRICEALGIDRVTGQILVTLDFMPEPGGTFLEKAYKEWQILQKAIPKEDLLKITQRTDGYKFTQEVEFATLDKLKELEESLEVATRDLARVGAVANKMSEGAWRDLVAVVQTSSLSGLEGVIRGLAKAHRNNAEETA